MFQKQGTFRVLLFVVVLALIVAGCAPAATAPTIVAPTAVVPALATAVPLPDTISVAEAATERDAGAYILDVRRPDEWNTVHIPGANLIPLDQLGSRLNEVPKDKEVVVICHSGNRSKQGRDILKNAGFSQVTSVAGGMNEWQAASLPTVTGP